MIVLLELLRNLPKDGSPLHHLLRHAASVMSLSNDLRLQKRTKGLLSRIQDALHRIDKLNDLAEQDKAFKEWARRITETTHKLEVEQLEKTLKALREENEKNYGEFLNQLNKLLREIAKVTGSIASISKPLEDVKKFVNQGLSQMFLHPNGSLNDFAKIMMPGVPSNLPPVQVTQLLNNMSTRAAMVHPDGLDRAKLVKITSGVKESTSNPDIPRQDLSEIILIADSILSSNGISQLDNKAMVGTSIKTLHAMFSPYSETGFMKPSQIKALSSAKVKIGNQEGDFISLITNQKMEKAKEVQKNLDENLKPALQNLQRVFSSPYMPQEIKTIANKIGAIKFDTIEDCADSLGLLRNYLIDMKLKMEPKLGGHDIIDAVLKEIELLERQALELRIARENSDKLMNEKGKQPTSTIPSLVPSVHSHEKIDEDDKYKPD